MSLLHLWQEGVVIVVLTSIPVAKRTCEPTKGCCLWTSMRPQVPFAYKMEKMFILFQGFRTCQHDGRCSRGCQGAEGGWAGWWVSPRGCRRGLCGAGFLEDGDHDDFGVDGVGDVEVVKVLRKQVGSASLGGLWDVKFLTQSFFCDFYWGHGRVDYSQNYIFPLPPSYSVSTHKHARKPRCWQKTPQNTTWNSPPKWLCTQSTN